MGILWFILILAINLAIIILVPSCKIIGIILKKLRLFGFFMTIVFVLLFDLILPEVNEPVYKSLYETTILTISNENLAFCDIVLNIALLLTILAQIKAVINIFAPDFSWLSVILLPFTISNRRKERAYIQYEEQVLSQFLRNQALVYRHLPEMEQEHHYYLSICQSEQEKTQFKTDWNLYINCAANRITSNPSDLLTFNEWFDKNGRWRYSTYNRAYLAEKHNQRSMGQSVPVSKSEAQSFQDTIDAYMAKLNEQ